MNITLFDIWLGLSIFFLPFNIDIVYIISQWFVILAGAVAIFESLLKD